MCFRSVPVRSRSEVPGEGAAPPPWATAIADLPPLGLQDALERAGELRARVGFSSRVLSF